jgi:hypothetical protein
VVPEVDVPDLVGFVAAGWGRIPNVERVGDECGELEEDEPLELAVGGFNGAGGGAGGATGAVGAWAAAGVGGAPTVGPNGWSLGIDVQLYWNSGTVSSSPVRNLYMSSVSNFVHKFCSGGVSWSKVALSLIKSFCTIFINGSRKLSVMPVFN